MENREIAKQIVTYVGGQENIKSVAHCATRLRIVVYEKDKIQEEKVNELPKVKGSFFNSGQFQIILGTGTVNKIYDEFNQLHVSTASRLI